MGNYLGVPAVSPTVMSTDRPRVGVDHPTVVPSNFQPDDSDADADDDRRPARTS